MGLFGNDDDKFQSTLPQEERRSPVPAACQRIEISIHAPTRGATLPEIILWS